MSTLKLDFQKIDSVPSLDGNNINPTLPIESECMDRVASPSEARSMHSVLFCIIYSCLCYLFVLSVASLFTVYLFLYLDCVCPTHVDVMCCDLPVVDRSGVEWRVILRVLHLMIYPCYY